MARKITMFELHFDGARFGPSFGADAEADVPADDTTGYADDLDADDESVEDADEETGSGSRARTLLLAVGVVAVTTVLGRRAARRFRTTDEDGDEFAVEDVEATDDPVVQ